MIRVAFAIQPAGTGWLGGVNYFRNLLKALSVVSDKIQPVAVVADPKDIPVDFPPMETLVSSVLVSRKPGWFMRVGLREIMERDWVLERELRRANVDVLSHSTWLGRNSTVPAITWIPDFQHVHLPNFFSTDEVSRRDKTFRKRIKNSTLVVVSSEMARSDLVNFAPQYAEKARVLRFADCSASAMSGTSAAALVEKYGLPEKYFLVPNQFWAHKNHGVVIKALSILKDRFPELKIVATGSTSDVRNVGYYAELQKLAAELRVQNEFETLGIVPYEDLAGLIRNALAIINPSLFEGWSTTVEEAKALGKRTVLSRIPVHVEQAPQDALYFDPHDPQDLATQLASLWEATVAGPSNAIQAETVALAEVRKREFAETFCEIAQEAVSILKSSSP